MKIDFVASNQDLKIGSYRIWIKDVVDILMKRNVDVAVHKSIDTIRESSVVIFSKGDYSNCTKVCSDHLVGAINVNLQDKNLPLDFLIVGSIEEKKTLERYYDNVAIVNLIENLYSNVKTKQHTEKQTIVFGYHGSYTHLSKLSFGFVDAFKLFLDQGKDLQFHSITNETNKAFSILKQIGLPEDRIKIKEWNFDNVLSDIKEFDVGVVPNITDLSVVHPELKQFVLADAGLYDTDYFFRLKNKSNSGRAFVLLQCGVPVITDLTPSNMPIFFDEKAGSIACCKKTWEKAMTRFMDHRVRNAVAKQAIQRFNSLYSMENDVTDLLNLIENIDKNL